MLLHRHDNLQQLLESQGWRILTELIQTERSRLLERNMLPLGQEEHEYLRGKYDALGEVLVMPTKELRELKKGAKR
jgi:hypothetical protein